MTITYEKAADYLPNVWGIGEEVNTRILLQTEKWEANTQGSVTTRTPGGQELQLSTDQGG